MHSVLLLKLGVTITTLDVRERSWIVLVVDNDGSCSTSQAACLITRGWLWLVAGANLICCESKVLLAEMWFFFLCERHWICNKLSCPCAYPKYSLECFGISYSNAQIACRTAGPSPSMEKQLVYRRRRYVTHWHRTSMLAAVFAMAIQKATCPARIHSHLTIQLYTVCWSWSSTDYSVLPWQSSSSESFFFQAMMVSTYVPAGWTRGAADFCMHHWRSTLWN